MAAPSPGAGASARGRVPAGERGTTTIADRVVAKVASRAAYEALSSHPGEQGRPAGTPPSASVTVRSSRVRISLMVELAYPVDIGGVCGALRRAVAVRVNELTGMSVSEVTVRVERFHPRGGAERLL